MYAHQIRHVCIYGGFISIKGLDSLEVCQFQHPVLVTKFFNAEGFSRVYFTKMEKSQGLFITVNQ